MTAKKDNSVHGKRYSEEQQAEFCEMAQSIGVGAAIRELGYPSYAMGVMWLDKRGIEPKAIDVMAKAREFHKYYQAEDLLKTVDEAMSVVTSMYASIETADDAKKLADAVSKLVNARLLLEGKANSISEKRETTQQDLELAELLRVEKAKQSIPNEVEHQS